MGHSCAAGALSHRAHRVAAHHGAGRECRAIGQAGVAAYAVVSAGGCGVGQRHVLGADHSYIARNVSRQVVVAQHGGTCGAKVAAGQRHAHQLVRACIGRVVSSSSFSDGGAIAALPSRDHIVARNQSGRIGAVILLTHSATQGHVGSRHRHICSCNGQGAIAKRDGVVAAGLPCWGNHVAAAHINCPNRSTAVAQRATQHRGTLVVHKAAVSDSSRSRVRSGEGRSVVGLAGIVGFNQQSGRRNHTGAGA